MQPNPPTCTLAAVLAVAGLAGLASCGGEGCGARPAPSTSASAGEVSLAPIPDPDYVSMVTIDQIRTPRGTLATAAPAETISQGGAPLASGALPRAATRALRTLATTVPEYVTTDPAVNRLLSLTESELDVDSAFFQRLGANQRTCASCHPPSAAWGTSVVQLQAIFDASGGGVVQDHLGLSAVFSPIDGAGLPDRTRSRRSPSDRSPTGPSWRRD